MQHRSATTTPTLVIIFTLLFSFLAPFNYLAWSRDVTLGWDPNPESDLLGYNVYVGEATGSYGLAMSAENNTTYTIQGLDDKKTYYFAVTAYNTSGTEGGPSNEIMLLAVEDTTPPTTPGDLKASVLSSTQITLTWDPATDDVGVTNYKISRDGILIKTQSGTQYTNSNLAPDTLYTYRVTAVDEAGNASKPAETSATTDAAPSDKTPPTVDLTAPSDRSAVSGMVIVSASASDNVEVMGVQFQVNAENLGPEDTTNDYSTNWDTSELEPGSYILTAIARDAAGNTTISTAVTVTIEVTTSNSLLSVSIGGSGTGTVASSPGGLVCSSGTCSSAFVTGSTVTLVAQPAKRWKFAGWSGACSGKMECVLQLLTNESVMATFSKKGGGGGKKGGPKK